MWTLAQYGYQTNSASGQGARWLLYLVIYAIFVAALWKIFVKAHQEGWKAIIPIYNSVIMFNIVGQSGWYAILLLIPLVNIFVAIWLAYMIAKAFGYGIGMTLLMVIGVGYLILGFGSAKYHGPSSGSPAHAE